MYYARVFKDYSLLREMGINSDASRLDIKAHKDEYKSKYIQWWLKQQDYTAEELEILITECKNDIKQSEEQLRQYLRKALKQSGLTAAEVDRRLGTQMSRHYFGRSQWEFPTQEYYEKMQEFLPLPQNYFEVYGLHELWQSLERLQSLQSLESLERYSQSYDKIKIEPDSVIYCDIPYRGRRGYGAAFDYDSFYDWACSQDAPVFISEYSMPEDRFVCVKEMAHTCSLSATATGKVTERLFVPKH